MPNQITVDGLETATRDEILAIYNTGFEAIYGSDIDVDPDTPDGETIGLFTQSVIDLEDLLTMIYTTFDPDQAFGTTLDMRVSINGIQRQAGTFTVTDITVVTSQALTLFGLDQDVEQVFTVQDNAGNKFALQQTQNVPSNGTYVYSFQAVTPGAVQTLPNTITIPVTVVLGVTTVNNPTTYITLGINEESDMALKIRRQKSVSLPSKGYLAGLLAALENVPGVTAAFVYENDTGTTDIDGVPGHSIWVIVSGDAAQDADIANAIYVKRNGGCGMFGSISYAVTQPDGSMFLVFWDVVSTEPLYTKFNVTSLDGVNDPNIALILQQLPLKFTPGVFAQVNVNELATIVQEIDPNALVTGAGFSTSAGGTYTNTLTPTAKNNQFALASNTIIILPIILSPKTATLAPAQTQQMTPLGGFGPYTYLLTINNSGGSVNASTGLYTAGPSAGADTVQVTDSESHTAIAVMTVT